LDPGNLDDLTSLDPGNLDDLTSLDDLETWMTLPAWMTWKLG